MAEQTFLTVDGSEMECLISVPAGGGPHPGLVLAPHLPADQGLKADAFSDNVADRYAEAGYVCVMPRVFHRQPLDRERPDKLAAMNDDEVMRDLTAARELLEARDDVNAGPDRNPRPLHRRADDRSRPDPGSPLQGGHRLLGRPGAPALGRWIAGAPGGGREHFRAAGRVLRQRRSKPVAGAGG